MMVNNSLECFEGNLIQIKSNSSSTTKELNDILSTDHNKQIYISKNITARLLKMFLFLFEIPLLVLLCMIACMIMLLLLRLTHKLI